MNKKMYLKDMPIKHMAEISLMIMKTIYKDGSKTVCVLADKTGEIKGNIQSTNNELIEGKVIKIQGIKDINLDVKKFEFINEYNLEDYLPTVKRPIEEIMDEIDSYTEKYITSKEGKILNDYFFKNEEFLDKFKRGIGGVSMHHNYIGGLAEHTLNVMSLSAMLAEKYNARRKEITVLAAKLHDIGKIHELYYDGPFKYTTRGEMEGHIVIGVEMINEAYIENKDKLNIEYVNRIKGIITQHHGKLEYGSPRPIRSEEAYIVNYADTIDATMNKVEQLKEKTKENTWSEYDRKLDGRLYL